MFGLDLRRVEYEALVHNVDSFTETGVSYFSEILFDVKRYQAGGLYQAYNTFYVV